MAETIEKASSGGDMIIWSVTFGLLIVAVIALAIWDKRSQND